MPKLSLFPRDVKIFAFLEQDAENLAKMAGQLKDMMYIWQNVKERAGLIADMEQDGDAITHDIMRYLYHSLITPLDREDISALANAMDDIADSIHAVSSTAYLYAIKETNPPAKEMSELILKAVQEVVGGIAEVNAPNRQQNLMKRCVAIHAIENKGDVVYRAALADLFKTPVDIFSVVKWREVYGKMEQTIDGCESFGDILEGIAIKYE